MQDVMLCGMQSGDWVRHELYGFTLSLSAFVVQVKYGVMQHAFY